MNTLFFADIDTQNDFMLPSGALYVPGSERIRPKLRRLFDFAAKNDIFILSSVDAHTADDPEFNEFPPHCVQGTKGQKKVEETLRTRRIVLKNRMQDRNILDDIRKYSQIILEKQDLDLFSNPIAARYIKALPSRAVVFGVATEYCIQIACVGLRRHGVHTVVLTDAIKALSAQGETEAMHVMRQAGVEFTDVDTLLGAGC